MSSKRTKIKTRPLEDFCFDWRKDDAITSVRNITTGTCWAAATIGACEAIDKIAHPEKPLQKLSIQHLIDCYDRYNKTKDGREKSWGHAGKALEYIVLRNDGALYTDVNYPHEEFDAKGPCAAATLERAATIEGVGYVENEEDLLEVIKCQPVIAFVPYWIFKDKKAGDIIMFSEVGLGGGFDVNRNPLESKRDHTVLIIGYGRERGVEYYLCQNNVGTYFMDEGYFKIQRNCGHPHGTASIAKTCYYPIIYGHGADKLRSEEGYGINAPQ